MNLNLNAAGIDRNTVSITDYQLVAAKVARVVISTTGNHTKESITAALGTQLKHLATPVEGSFRMIKPNVAVGYVRANTEVRAIADTKELRASYKVMSSNIMMDNKDKTLWEVKTGAGGTFLARHGNEDLSELVNAAVNRRPDVPRLAQLAKATASPREFVAFASASGDMDYGFCVAASASQDKIKVVSSATGLATVIPNAAVVTVVNVKIPLSAHKRIVEAGIDRQDAAQEVEYYSRLYSYDPAYLNEVIEQIEGTATV